MFLSHTFSEQARKWATIEQEALAIFYLHFENIKSDCRNAETVARLAEIASGLGRYDSDAVEMACLVGIGRTLSRNGDSGLQAAAKVAHMYPGSPEAWSVLVSFVNPLGPDVIKAFSF